MEANYFFIDGSALTAQVRQLWRSHPQFRGRKVIVRLFIDHFVHNFEELTGGSWKRATFYFPTGDEAAIDDHLLIPDHRTPGAVRDIHFKFCGHKLKKSTAFDKFVEEAVPAEFKSRFSKSEKGIDTEICCDALRLASLGRLERLFLVTNDSDFVPLCRTVKEFGANISILHLFDTNAANQDLLRASDSFDVVSEEFLEGMLSDPPADAQGLEAASPSMETQSEKPEAEPSDLKALVSGSDDQPEVPNRASRNGEEGSAAVDEEDEEIPKHSH